MRGKNSCPRKLPTDGNTRGKSNRVTKRNFITLPNFLLKWREVGRCTGLSERQISVGPIKVDGTSLARYYVARACDWRVFESRDFYCKKAGNRGEWWGNLQTEKQVKRSRKRNSWIDFLWNFHWNCIICTITFYLEGLVAISVHLKKKTVSSKEKCSFCGPRP